MSNAKKEATLEVRDVRNRLDAKSSAPPAESLLSRITKKLATVIENERVSFALEKQKVDIPTPAELTAGEESAPPWLLPPEYEHLEGLLKRQLELLAEEPNNFLRRPPFTEEEFQFTFHFLEWVPTARVCLGLFPALERMRYKLVPSRISEETFWRHFFTRVQFLRRAIISAAHEKTRTLQSAGAPQPDEDSLEATIAQELLNHEPDSELHFSGNDTTGLEEEIASLLAED